MSAELKQAIDKLNAEWTGFKAENDRRLKEIEAKGKSDPLTEEKISKHSAAVGELQARVDELQKVMQRRGPGGEERDEGRDLQAKHVKLFEAYVRRGKDDGLAEVQAAVSVGSDPDGGYAVPLTIDKEIEQYERDNTPMRQLCRVIAVSNENYEKLVNKGGAGSGWVDETETRPETTTAQLAALKPYFGEVYANPFATQKSLDDLGFDVAAWLAEEVGMEFSEQENDAFTRGNGVKKAKGILGYDLSTSVDGVRAFGSIQKVHSGSAGNFVADKLLDLIHSLKRGYRKNAVIQTSALGVAALRKLKDGQNNYLWQPSTQAGQPSALFGYPVEENDDIPEPAADANALMFGDFRRAYTIVDVRGIRVIRDELTAKPKVGFYTTKRVGGFVTNDRAVKVLTLSA